MPTIDQENAKQIRQPMDVLITMPLEADGITLTFSGYSSSAKVADGRLNRSTFPMRTLADLQGEGFELDGTAVLYDPNTSPSVVNGKLGVRGNVGEGVDLRVTGNKTIPQLTISVTGASSVTANGVAKSITGATVTIPVLSSAIDLIFSPASNTERIEISNVAAEANFEITNENLIRAIVSLRSDLSLFGQTLPESELNVEVYHAADVTEEVAKIPRNTPVFYSAGYPGDMTDERSFYVAEQVTWEDNVLTIHAVDSVHFLDNVTIVPAITSNEGAFSACAGAEYVLQKAGVTYDDWGYSPVIGESSQRFILKEGTNGRDYIAFLNQCLNITDINGYLLDGTGRLWGPLQFTYRDAGWPALSTDGYVRMENWRTIEEEDCANVKKEVDSQIGVVSAEWQRITNPSMSVGDAHAQKVGTATLTKNIGTSLSFDKYAYEWEIGLYLGENSDNETAKKLINKYGTVYGLYKVMPVVPVDETGSYITWGTPYFVTPAFGDMLPKGDISRENYRRYSDGPDPASMDPFPLFVPWSQSYDGWRYDTVASRRIRTATQMWNVLVGAKVVNSGGQTIDLDIYGCAFNLDKQSLLYTKNEEEDLYEYGELPFYGQITDLNNNGANTSIYPKRMLMAPMYRSNVRGSFTWKGDPRMQPRDVVDFRRLDGTREQITLENITLTHEGGGTSAEITYRKGVI